MPILIAIIVLSAIAGFVARGPIAYAIAGILVLLVNVSLVWAVADGKGDDPVWLIPIGPVGGLLALAACRGTQSVRDARQGRRAVRPAMGEHS